MQITRMWRMAAILALQATVLFWATRGDAQFIGARSAESHSDGSAATLDHRAIENFITIEGKVEKRLDPTALRIVLALLVEQPTAADCQRTAQQREAELIEALKGMDIDGEAVVVDFISILPVYQWQVETREGKSVAVEQPAGFRMQSNVHVKVASEKQARAVLAEAFRLGVSDVIAFDYGSEKIDRTRKEARKEALRAAQEKADLLLGAMFDEPPRPLNVHESTRVIYPRSLYGSFENAHTEAIRMPYSGDRMPTIQAARPKNTYYQGVLEDTDVRDGGLPLRAQISVVSTVRLYYATPANIGGNERNDE
ncbi:MAG: SIMPL domain-containing protein [Planctomycetota bacterium]